MKLAYEGYDMAGKPVAGLVDAQGVPEAAEHLRRQGLFITSIGEGGAAVPADAPSAAPRGARPRGRSKELVAFFRQLSILVGTHTPLVQALDAIERQTPEGAWRAVIADLRRRVEEGTSLSVAMEAHANRFDAISRSMVAAGESGGRLDVMLRGLAEMVRQQYHVRRSVVGAMVYPAVLIAVSLAVLVVTLFFVLPQFRGLFDTLQVPLPPTTALLMGASGWAASHWWAVVGALGALVAGGVAVARSAAARAAIDRFLVFAPRIGPIVRAFSTARIARVMGVLLDARIPMLEAVRLARQGTSNSCYARLLDRAESAITRGESLADTLSHSGLVVPSICEALASGERSGELGPVLIQVASFLDEDNEVLVKALMSIIEPIILTFLGVIIGFVAVSMFLPLFDIATLGGQASQ
jgi:type II secretory pathway component PulF